MPDKQDLTCNFEVCTPDRVLMALEHAKTEMSANHKRQSTSHLAGIIVEHQSNWDRNGLLVFVTVARFDEERLRKDPESCGFMIDDE